MVVILNNDSQKQEFLLQRKDCTYETFRARGPGGQHKNTTDSAVRITHVPTGTVVTATEDRSQHVNKRVAEQRLTEILELQYNQSRHTMTNELRASHFNEARSWSWTTWRDEVINSKGVKFSMKRALKGNLVKLL